MTAKRLVWCDEIAHRLLSYAAGRAPLELAARLKEEWQADMAQRQDRWSRLRFAMGCCWATNVIAREYAVTALPATAAGPRFLGYVPQSPLFSRRTTTFLLVASLHAVILFALITMHSKFLKTSQHHITVRLVDQARAEPPPSLPRPQLFDPRIAVAPPESPLKFEAPSEDAIQTVVHEPAIEPAAPPFNSSIRRVQGGPGGGFPSADDFYPSVALHMGEQGVVTVRACVDARGFLTNEPAIVESSGSRRLDEGALKLARAGSGHYRASREEGRPVDSCYPFRIRFSLK